MGKFQIVPLLAVSMLSLSVQANAYQAEARGELGLGDRDGIRFGGEYYLQGVNATSGPLKEAAFLEKASSIRAFYSNTDVEGGDDLDGILFGGRYVDPNSGIFGDASIGTGDIDGYKITGGIYLDSQSTVGVFLLDNDNLGDGFGIEYKNLVAQNNATYINLEASVSLLESDFGGADWTQIEGLAEYYFDKTTSAVLGISLLTGDIDGDSIDIGANKFFSPTLSGGVTFTRASVDNFDDSNSFIIDGRLRF